MSRNMYTLWSIATTSLVTITAWLHADTDNAQMRNLDNRVTALEQRRSANGVINPPARPQVKNGFDLFVYGDLLFWQAHQNGMAVGIVSQSSSLQNFINDGKTKNIHFDWDVGFRVGVGYNVPHDGWDLNLTWLRFYTDGHRKSHADSDQVIYPVAASASNPLNLDATYAKFHSHWRLHLDQIDLDLGREFFVSKWLTLRPHIGLRTDWIRQKWHVSYEDAAFPLNGQDDVKTKRRDHWWGLGLAGGLDSQWGLGGGWSVYANLGAAILYGFHKLPYKEQNSSPSTTFMDLKNSPRISHPILDLALGLQWDEMFSRDRFHINLHAGWEHHAYFSQNQFQYFNSTYNDGMFLSNQGDLTFQGWTFGGRFDF